MAGFDADAYLDSLEPIGWRLGLERMYRLTTALGLPQHRFASIHIVGTNGKSSVARMTAALLEAHGVDSGACLSPPPARWSARPQGLDAQTPQNTRSTMACACRVERR